MVKDIIIDFSSRAWTCRRVGVTYTYSSGAVVKNIVMNQIVFSICATQPYTTSGTFKGIVSGDYSVPALYQYCIGNIVRIYKSIVFNNSGSIVRKTGSRIQYQIVFITSAIGSVNSSVMNMKSIICAIELNAIARRVSLVGVAEITAVYIINITIPNFKVGGKFKIYTIQSNIMNISIQHF